MGHKKKNNPQVPNKINPLSKPSNDLSKPEIQKKSDKELGQNVTDESLKQKEEELKEEETRLINYEKRLDERNKDITQREMDIKLRELDAQKGFSKLYDEKLREAISGLEERESAIENRWKELEAKAKNLHEKEILIERDKISRDNGFQSEREAFEVEKSEKRRIFEIEMSSMRTKRIDELDADLEKERLQRKNILDKELIEKRNQATEELNEMKASFLSFKKTEEENIKSKKETFQKLKAELDNLSDEIKYERIRIEASKKSLTDRERLISEEVESKIQERKKSFETEMLASKSECERLRESIKNTSETLNNYEELKRKLGNEEPEKVLLKLKKKEEDLKNLRQELLERPTLEMQKTFDEAKNERQRLQNEIDQLADKNKILSENAKNQEKLEFQIEELKDTNLALNRRMTSLLSENERLNNDIQKFTALYTHSAERDKRIRDIEVPDNDKVYPRMTGQIRELKFLNIQEDRLFTELEWLDNIEKACLDYGLKFPKRMLYAFHTALKTAEWSPLTVLAGVSGTGKSELPKLYSHFGGLRFLNLAVQPNWDSQESMLGFFNSIDNKFDAQPVLKLLAQTQKENSSDYPGLNDVMSLILLDEMNLAHVELYFAEFLSKLESRRSNNKHDVPLLDVKLGAGVPPYKLPLGRNVLWTGTMNQDETTKSLSDKVIDRGIIIHFPRPKSLESRPKHKTLSESIPLLSKSTWGRWCSKEIKFKKDEIKEYKVFIEEMNEHLAKAGRAIGHRVWQSIEYYISNYPTIKALEVWEGNGKERQFVEYKDPDKLKIEMKKAFEDQLVQKVMPKLRGIETRSRSGQDNCLDNIKQQLIDREYSIVEDFEQACKFGYGQFMWNSANYLLKDEKQEEEIEKYLFQGEQSKIYEALTAPGGLDSTKVKDLFNAGLNSKESINTANAKTLLDMGFNKNEIILIRKILNGNK